MADGEETYLPLPFIGSAVPDEIFVMKGSGFVWSGQTPWPSSLLALTIIEETINFTIEAQGHLAPSMWGILSLSEVAWENKKCYFVSDLFNVYLFIWL